MATGLDEDYKKPKNLTDQVVRLLDDEAVPRADRIRLIIAYIMHRDGIFDSDIEKLLAHAQLPPQDIDLIRNMDLLGTRVLRQIKTPNPPQPKLFPKVPPPPSHQTDEVSLSRFDPLLKPLLEDQLKGTLDQNIFPYTKPLLDSSDALNAQMSLSQSSLRSAKPTWARTRPSANEPRQRIFVFVAGGATYSESRACYEISRQYSRDVFLATSHMLTPGLFLRQIGDLSVDRRRLDLPADRPPKKAPAWVFEREAQQPQPGQGQGVQPPTKGMGNMTISSNNSTHSAQSGSNGAPPGTEGKSHHHGLHLHSHSKDGGSGGKLVKAEKEKKKGFFRF